jgi:hypothetical protein
VGDFIGFGSSFLGAQLCAEPGADSLQLVLPSVIVGAVGSTGSCFLIIKAIQERNFSQFCLVADANLGFRVHGATLFQLPGLKSVIDVTNIA